MYKLLLCVRYLRTRYIALASIVSVMLGVATMIVVNSVMSGFATEMRTRINGILADIVIETHSYDGEPNPDAMMKLARRAAGDQIDAMTATVQVFGLMHFPRGGQWIPRPVELVGIDPESKSKVGPFIEHLDSYKELREKGVLTRAPLRKLTDKPTWELTAQANAYRREKMQRMHERMLHFRQQEQQQADPLTAPNKDREEPKFDDSQAAAVQTAEAVQDPNLAGNAIQQVGAEDPEQPTIRRGGDDIFQNNPFGGRPLQPANDFDPADPTGPCKGRVIVGAGLVEWMTEDENGELLLRRGVEPGDDVKITTVSAGRPPRPVSFPATIVDIYKSGMSEYDSSLVFCNLEYLQEIRGMIDPASQERAVTAIQIKLKDYNQAAKVVSLLENAFPRHQFSVKTWEQKQGPLLAAVDIESAILNVLLFLIIAVAGFGILAIFFMIVVEKTRDIGILKALGASSQGVMSIFLLYGLGLGMVGSGVGVGIGLLFVRYINEIEAFLAIVTGRKVFDERIYYFPTIPTAVNAFTVTWVAVGAVAIAVMASILPARRAARLHPVQALRYE